jgi:alpha-beta hydrolase superfamily lysophospholipase
MKTFEWNWQSRDGLKMFARGWEPDGQPAAVIVLLHGHGEHIGRYAHVGQAFANAGFALLGFDLRGHGLSEGPRGHTPSYQHLNNDVTDFWEQAERRYPGAPCFLYGHSMGGNLALNYALTARSALKGVIATGPWLRLAFEPPAAKVALGRVMNNIAPAFAQPSGIEQAALSRDAEVVRAYASDPLVHDRISARLFLTIYDSGLWIIEHAAGLSLPTLLMHGGADRLTSCEASREFAAKSDKVTLRVWDGFYHEIHNEPEKAQVIQVMIDWMKERLQGK